MRTSSLLVVVVAVSSCAGAHVQMKPPPPPPSAPRAEREAYYFDHKPVMGGAFMQLANGERVTVMEELLTSVDATSDTAVFATTAASARAWGSVGMAVGVIGGILFVPSGGWLAVNELQIYSVNCVGGGALCDLINTGPTVLFAASSVGLLGGIVGAVVADVVAHYHDARAFETYDASLKKHLRLDEADQAVPSDASAPLAP